jgi:hypothetical protein
MKFSTKKHWVSTDGWRGYEKPIYAVFGANDTGTWEDSPCNSNTCKAELTLARKLMKKAGFPLKICVARSSNVFCAHVYLIASIEQFEEAKAYAQKLYDEQLRDETRLLYL